MPNPKRVLFFEAYNNGPDLFGAQRSLLSLLEGIDPQAIRAALVVPDVQGALADRVRSLGLIVLALPHLERIGGTGRPLIRVIRGLKAFVASQRALFRILVSQDPEAVYVNDLRSLFVAGPLCRVLRIPLIWYVRTEEENRAVSYIATWFASRIILIANGVRSTFPRWVKDSLFSTLHTGFPLEDYVEHRDSSGNVGEFDWTCAGSVPVVGYVGSWVSSA